MLNSLDINTGIILGLHIDKDSCNGKLSKLTVAVKDLFHIKGIPTSAGNPDWLATHEPPKITASSLEALLENGATIIGKSLTDELAYSLNGTNFHYGTPLNLKSLKRLPGGSSSGSAVAVTSGVADIGLGTDTGGSIRVPASYNGLFGLRPTHGVIPMDNMVALAPSFDTVGWLTRDVQTLALVAETLLPKAKSLSTPNKLIVLKPIINDVTIWHSDIDCWIDERKSYFISVEQISFDSAFYTEASNTFRVLQGAEIWKEHGEWIEATSPKFAPDIQTRFEWCKTLTKQDVEKAKQAQKQIVAELDKVLPNGSFVMLLPTTPGAAPLLNSSRAFMDEYRTQLMGLTALAGLSGRPQLNLPVLESESAPWGLSLLGAQNSDLSIIELSKQLLGNL
ncbi:amidase family protein [Thiomicrorhabdus hydrogeniphila]